ncbi:CpaE family protein [Streptomyces albidoflavus]
MTLRILPAAGDQDAARVLATLLAQLPDAEPAQALPDSTALLDTLAALAAESLDELPEVVLVHERMGPAPALDLVREVTRRFPSVGVVLITTDTGTAVITAAMDAGARGIVALPMSYEALAERVQAAAVWSLDMRRHLATGSGRELLAAGGGGRVVTVSGAKGGVGTTLTAVQLALAAQASGRSTALLDLDLQSGDTASYLDVQFRRSVADLAAIRDVTPRVLADVVFTHESGLAVIPAPAEGERGEDVTDRTARQVVTVLRGRYDVVIVDCGTQMAAANAAAVELADEALLVLTPDVVAVRAAKRQIRLWERLQIRKAEETTTVVNRYGKGTEINPALVARITGTRVARTTVPAHYRELQSALDAGRVQDLDAKSTVKQALWGLAGELGLGPREPDRPTGRKRRGAHGDRGAVTLEFAGIFPLVLVVLALLWQCALYGYSYTLAGNAADEGARAATAAHAAGDSGPAACRTAATRHLPSAWSGAAVTCTDAGSVWQATVKADVPLFFPGVNPGWKVTGRAGAAFEGER